MTFIKAAVMFISDYPLRLLVKSSLSTFFDCMRTIKSKFSCAYPRMRPTGTPRFAKSC